MDIDKDDAEEAEGEEDDNEEGEDAEAENEEEDSSDGEDASDQSAPPSPRVPDNDYEDAPAKPSGFSAFRAVATAFTDASTDGPSPEPPAPPRGGLGSTPRRGIGGGIGFSSSAAQSTELPTAFGGESNRPQRSFLRKTDIGSPRPTPTLSAHEAVHFSKLQGTFGAKMMAKMGWQVVSLASLSMSL